MLVLVRTEEYWHRHKHIFPDLAVLMVPCVFSFGDWQVFGIRGGFAGFYSDSNPPVELTSKDVEMLQHKAGSVLG